jgi:hypothetical protein
VQYAALRAWLIEVTTALLDPAEHGAPTATPRRAESFLLESPAAAAGQAPQQAAANGRARTAARAIGSAFFVSLGGAAAARRGSEDGGEAAATGAAARLEPCSTQGDRFRYVVRLVSRARIWRMDGGALFTGLQSVVQGFTDQV